MRLLLDTHVVLWFLRGDLEVPLAVRALVRNRANLVYVSVASLWEIAIKVSRQKLVLPRRYEDLFPTSLEPAGFDLLPISVTHVTGILSLPHHHRDPFDRLLVAQAVEENMTLVTCDAKLAAYPVKTFWG